MSDVVMRGRRDGDGKQLGSSEDLEKTSDCGILLTSDLELAELERSHGKMQNVNRLFEVISYICTYAHKVVDF